MVPQDLKYTAEHEWVRAEADGTTCVGITDFAQDALGDVVFVSLPTAGTQVAAGGVLGEVESTKSVSEVYAPFAGEVLAVNSDLEGKPDLLNTDAYGAGWIVTIRPADPAALDRLLDAAAYQASIDAEA